MKLTICLCLAVAVYYFGPESAMAQFPYTHAQQTISGYSYHPVAWYNGPFGYQQNNLYGVAYTNAYLFFANGYNPGSDKALILPVVEPMAQNPSLGIPHGSYDSNEYAFDQTIDYSAAQNVTMGPADHIELDMENVDGQGMPGPTTQIAHPVATGGEVLVEARVTADGGKTWKPATGASIVMQGPGASQYSTTATVRDLAASSVAVFGNKYGDNTTTVTQTTDAEFPAGLQSQNYTFYCTYGPHTVSSAVFPGSGLVGQTVLFSFDSVAGTGTAGTYTEGSSPTGTTLATGAAPSSGSGTGGTPGLTDFISGFWDKLKAFVESELIPTPADRDALAAAFNGLLNSGPAALVPSLFAELNKFLVTQPGYLPGPVGQTGEEPNVAPYWRWDVFPQNSPVGLPDYNGPGSPLNYDVGQDPEIVHAPTVYEAAGYMPQWIDLSAFKRELLWLRRFIWISTWFFFIQRAVNELTPKFRI